MWKDFFYFNKSERIGTIVLLILIFALATYRFFILPSIRSERRALRIDEAQALERIQDQMQSKQKSMPKGKINPILLDSTGFIKIGFSKSEVHEIMNHRRTAEDADFFLFFYDFAVDKNIEWTNHIADPKF